MGPLLLLALKVTWSFKYSMRGMKLLLSQYAGGLAVLGTISGSFALGVVGFSDWKAVAASVGRYVAGFSVDVLLVALKHEDLSQV